MAGCVATTSRGTPAVPVLFLQPPLVTSAPRGVERTALKAVQRAPLLPRPPGASALTPCGPCVGPWATTGNKLVHVAF